MDSQAGRKAKTVRSASDQRPRGTGGSSFGARTDLRGRPAAGAYAYRSERSALDAVRHVHKLLNTGHEQIVDADLSGYFDSIPHAELLKSVARRIVDGAMLPLIKMWLEAPVEETDEQGKKHRSTRNRDDGKGTPQGAPITPLTQKVILAVWAVGSS